LLVALIWISFGYTPLFSIPNYPVSAQIASPLSPSSPVGVKIASPVPGQQVNIDSSLKIRGTSTDTPSTNCQASVIVNNIKPYQPVTPAGINDYSTWNFLLNSSYTSIKEGSNNKITAKLVCPPNLTKWYSVNVTGIPLSSATSNSTLISASNLVNPNSDTRTSTTNNNPHFNASIINITSPVSGQQVPSGSKVTIFGTSMDDFYRDCKVYAKKNDLPFQNTTAAGLTGSRDYSVWRFAYTDEHGLITPGNTNNITAKISCNESKTFSYTSASIDSNNPKNTITSYANVVLMGINQPPLAAVHVNSQEAKEGDEIVLDGKDSSDPNGDPLTYFWKQTSGFLDGFDIINPTDSVAHFKVPEDLTKDTTFEFELDVRDNFGGISTESVSIDATSNTAPIADAGGNLQAIRGEQVTLDGSASHDPDPTGKIMSYLWKSGEDNDGVAGLSLQNANQPVAVFSVPLVQDDTTFEFTLTVTDDEGATAEDTVQVKVKGNSKPVADAGSSSKTAEIGEQVTLDGIGSHDADPNGQIVDYNWEQTSGSHHTSLNGANSATASFTAPAVEDDTTFEFTLTVTDDEGATAEDTVEVEIEAPSPPPPPPSQDPDPPEEPEDRSDEPFPSIPNEEDEEIGEEQNADSDLNSAELQNPEAILETCFEGINIDNDGQFEEECEP
jgi:hypothetical protein